MLDVCSRSFACDGILVAEDEDVLIFAEEAVNVFKFAVGGFGVEAIKVYSIESLDDQQEDLQVDDGNEGGVEDGPDDVKFPL